MDTGLTRAQQGVLDFMVRHQEAHSRPPSLREICAEFGFASHSAARRHVLALARKGFASQTGDGKAWAPKVRQVQDYFFAVPVFGTIPAGLPDDSPALSDETVRIDPSTFRLRTTKGLLALRVKGDSMTDAQIADGDIALLRVQEPQVGDIVAALIDNSTTLKRLVCERNRVLLRAENQRYRDLVPAESLIIQGVLVGVIGCGKR